MIMIKEKTIEKNIYEVLCRDDKKYVIMVRDKEETGLNNSLRLEIFSTEKDAMDCFDKIEQYGYWCGYCGFTYNNSKIKFGSERPLNCPCPKCGEFKYVRGEKDFSNN